MRILLPLPDLKAQEAGRNAREWLPLPDLGEGWGEGQALI